jgi:hypothetical protein
MVGGDFTFIGATFAAELSFDSVSGFGALDVDIYRNTDHLVMEGHLAIPFKGCEVISGTGSVELHSMEQTYVFSNFVLQYDMCSHALSYTATYLNKIEFIEGVEIEEVTLSMRVAIPQDRRHLLIETTSIGSHMQQPPVQLKFGPIAARQSAMVSTARSRGGRTTQRAAGPWARSALGGMTDWQGAISGKATVLGIAFEGSMNFDAEQGPVSIAVKVRQICFFYS